MPDIQSEITVKAPVFSTAQIEWDLRKRNAEKNRKYMEYWEKRKFCAIPVDRFSEFKKVSLEIGAGSGDFALKKSLENPENLFVAVERDKNRGKSLEKRSQREQRKNLVGLRGNIIPALSCGVKDASVDTIYVLYPCPWPRNSQRKNRWYLHPLMAHMIRTLKPGGMLVWASDQKFYIDEGAFVCEKIYGLQILSHGVLAPNPWNDLQQMPQGRTKFERNFLESDQPCYELIVQKPLQYDISLFH